MSNVRPPQERHPVARFIGWLLITVGIFWIVLTGGCVVYAVALDVRLAGTAILAGLCSAFIGAAIVFAGRAVAGIKFEHVRSELRTVTPSFGAKGNSDAGVQLLWFCGFGIGAVLVLIGAVLMLRSEFWPDQGVESADTVIGAVVAGFGAAFVGALAYLRERYGSQ